ncbi:interleukin-1 receptor type 2-like [Bufo gargarizans]|uniref:interleukin-1 receptor type 2-like n=1 Tax=Bufo gargarizans TaxID=30331 RepID=UPI001CF2C3B5|nr:interleukin-1 receptor type 2-like [Bufo gargarizans]XP_044143264.1 interleukin-1 receptor type 2-like [Bufo gargarizans]
MFLFFLKKETIGVCYRRNMWFPLIIFGTCLLETSGFNVYRLNTGEKCQVQITHSVGYYVLDEELATIQCPISQHLQLDRSTFHLVWTRNGLETMDTAEQPRIQQKEDTLWFLPAVKEDTGIYTCIMRNASYCAEISMSLKVMSNTPSSYPYIKYEYIYIIGVENNTFEMICPALPNFIKDHINVNINWYKDGEPLRIDSSKYRYLDGTTYVSINDVGYEDEGYYKCQLTFSLENKDYTMSRIIQLQIIDEGKRQQPVIVNTNHKTIAAATGSKLIIPCKVFAGHDDGNLMIWWTANDSFMSDYSTDHRVTQGMLQEITEADGQYFDLPLIFERIEEEDFITDFKCIASNDYGLEVLPTQIKQAAYSFAWYIAAVPALVVFLIIAIIFITKYRKCGNKKDYPPAKS